MPAAIYVSRYDEPAPWRWSRHAHSDHQFIWAPAGAVCVRSDDHDWLVPPTFGLWIPARVPHAVEGSRAARVYCAYSDPAWCPIHWAAPTVVTVSGFVREAIIRLDECALTSEERTRTEAVLYDAIQPASTSPIQVPLPTDERLLAIAAALSARPADPRGLIDWGIEVGASVRTLTRLFVNETGMTFAEWRLQVRLRAAVALLAGGVSVSATARSVGYRRPSAFVHAFRRVTGQTPGSYFVTATSNERRDREPF